MTDGDKTLPPGIERVIREVLDTAELDFVDGASDVERELRAHFEDGIAAGSFPEDLIARFGDPAVAEYRTWDEVFENFGAVYTYREIGADLTDGDRPSE